ncbi:MAG TPA: hypothetical protein VN902_09680 [Candidatus Acidoferrales bacterium]|nr:hypothetical protein [Candidatus Acidoferrales bacterium]
MQRNGRGKSFVQVLLTASSFLLLHSPFARCQNAATPSAPGAAATDSAPDIRALADSVRALQTQVQSLNSQVSELRAAEEREHAEARELRSELNRATAKSVAPPSMAHDAYAAATSSPENTAPTPAAALAAAGPATAAPTSGDEGATIAERVTKLEDSQELTDAKVLEQSQTKVESGSKYRVRLSGMVLLNAFETRGAVDNLDFPEIAMAPGVPGTSGAFSGSLRQSQLGVEVFGPDVAGAHTSANVKFDFAGGQVDTSNGAVMGIVRLRTGTIRMDWADTSIVAGQDAVFFAPLVPTSLASLAVPALSYSGNLWMWTPQIRVEHRVALSDDSSLLLQAGILDSLTSDYPDPEDRVPSEGEQSGQPAYAARVAWSHHAFGRDVTVGVGGYYGRQNWGFGRGVDGWAGTTDVTIPLGKYFDFTGEFYRGRAVGGFGGGVGQSVLLSGPQTDPATVIRGLDSMGGWAQLKYKPRANFEVNFALGQDNPFAGELRNFPATEALYGQLISRNLTPFVNFIYHARSNVLFSAEYRRLQTYNLDSNLETANQIGLSVGYIF